MIATPETLPSGVFAASLTPLRADLSVDHAAFARHCRTLLDNGCDGIVPWGTTGEANSFSVAERTDALDRLIAAGIPADRLLVGTGCCALPDTVTLTRHALACGVSHALVLPPFYYKNVSDEGLYGAHARLIERLGDARLRVYLYHFPQMTGVPISLALIGRLRDEFPEVVVGIKDSSGDWEYTRRVCAQFPGFRVYAASERLLADTLRIGGAGCISATTNVTSAIAAEIHRDWQDPGIGERLAYLTAVRQVIERYPLIPALKTIMAQRSGRPDWRHIRPPHVALDKTQEATLLDRLKALGFLS